MDRTKTVYAAEHLLDQIWPQKDTTKLLRAIGDPEDRLSGEDETELRERLGRTLYPEYFTNGC